MCWPLKENIKTCQGSRNVCLKIIHQSWPENGGTRATRQRHPGAIAQAYGMPSHSLQWVVGTGPRKKGHALHHTEATGKFTSFLLTSTLALPTGPAGKAKNQSHRRNLSIKYHFVGGEGSELCSALDCLSADCPEKLYREVLSSPCWAELTETCEYFV